MKLINKLISIGIDENTDQIQIQVIKLTNITSFLCIITLLVVLFLENFFAHYMLTFNLTALTLFSIPIILNRYRQYNLAKGVLLLIFYAVIFIGSYVLHFTDRFAFSIIVPVTLFFVLFQDCKGGKFIIMLFTTLVFLIFDHIKFFSKPEGVSTQDTIDYWVSLLAFTVFIAAFVFGLRRILFFRKSLEKQFNHEKTIAEFSKHILSGNNNLSEALEIILAHTQTSRAYIFKAAEDEKHITLIAEATAKGVYSQLENGLFQNFNIEAAGFLRWRDVMKEQQIIKGLTKDFPPDERHFLSLNGIKSTIAIPIYAFGKWQGYIGFDDIEVEREWPEEWITLLRTTADLLGLYMENISSKEKIQEQNEELIKQNATKDKFFSIVAHDLKTPFNAIIPISQLLVEELGECKNEDLYEYATIIKEGSQSAFDYLQNLLEWSRLQTNRVNYNPERFQLSLLMKNVKEMLSLQANAKHITIVDDIKDSTFLYGDITMVRTILVNLISNAIKYSFPNSEIKVAATKAGEHIKIAVIDSGTGIPLSVQETLFEISKSTSQPGTNKETGTGLGLILCKDFVELNKGQISVESKEKKGSIFMFTIPQAAEKAG